MSAVPQKIAPERISTPEPLAGLLLRLGVSAQTYGHPPVFRVGEDDAFIHLIPGGHTKNLFLKDKKGQLWLVTALQDTAINLKGLSDHLQSPRFSFGNAELLLEVLGVTPGSVTPFALMNDTARRVKPVLDARMMDCGIVNFHPLVNDKTTGIAPDGLRAFMDDQGYQPLIVDFTKI